MEEEEENSESNERNGDDVKRSQVYLPGKPLEEGEELVHDRSTYRMYHVVCSLVVVLLLLL